MATHKLNAKLSEWWELVFDLKPDSPQEDWDKFSSHINPDALFYNNGMTGPPARGIEEIVSEMKKLLGFWSIIERRVVSEGTDAAGKTAFCCMNNRLAILGEEIDFPETQVVMFDDQERIIEQRLYCNPAPITEIIQRKKSAAT
ncbi:hypothetical protein G7Z17_g7071 [Cylindrodendrum hubeiense]|uniref:SnoaL-like domain-containing protein n=1 Tax=Cylindrodendrum hubeiense TaxID=595255 RepID=A0A9P5H8L7_9HYPO|nr:hypothetical protein G7Z17_g7071 [Cylindrodendrum hubeiense]